MTPSEKQRVERERDEVQALLEAKCVELNDCDARLGMAEERVKALEILRVDAREREERLRADWYRNLAASNKGIETVRKRAKKAEARVAELSKGLAAIVNHAPDEWSRDIAVRTLEGSLESWLSVAPLASVCEDPACPKTSPIGVPCILRDHHDEPHSWEPKTTVNTSSPQSTDGAGRVADGHDQAIAPAVGTGVSSNRVSGASSGAVADTSLADRGTSTSAPARVGDRVRVKDGSSAFPETHGEEGTVTAVGGVAGYWSVEVEGPWGKGWFYGDSVEVAHRDVKPGMPLVTSPPIEKTCPVCREPYQHVQHPLKPAGVVMQSLCGCTRPRPSDAWVPLPGDAVEVDVKASYRHGHMGRVISTSERASTVEFFSDHDRRIYRNDELKPVGGVRQRTNEAEPDTFAALAAREFQRRNDEPTSTKGEATSSGPLEDVRRDLGDDAVRRVEALGLTGWQEKVVCRMISEARHAHDAARSADSLRLLLLLKAHGLWSAVEGGENLDEVIGRHVRACSETALVPETELLEIVSSQRKLAYEKGCKEERARIAAWLREWLGEDGWTPTEHKVTTALAERIAELVLVGVSPTGSGGAP